MGSGTWRRECRRHYGGRGIRRSIRATVPAAAAGWAYLCPTLQEMDPEATVFFTPCAVPHLYLPPPPSPITPLMPHYLVLCPYAVRPGYAYPSALLWVDLLINKVGPCQKMVCVDLHVRKKMVCVDSFVFL